MEWYAFNLPFIFSSLLDGGTCRSIRFWELLSILNFRLEMSWSWAGKSFTRSPSQIFLVIFDPKETIILSHRVTYVKGKYFTLEVQMFKEQCGTTARVLWRGGNKVQKMQRNEMFARPYMSLPA